MSYVRNLPFVMAGLRIFDLCFLCFILISFQLVKTDPQGIEGSVTNQNEAIDFLQRNEFESSSVCNAIMEASWNYHTNVTELNRQQMSGYQTATFMVYMSFGAEFRRNNWREATRFRWRSFGDVSLRRIFSIATVLGSAALPAEERVEYAELLQSMKVIYAEARICPYDPNRVVDETFLTRPRTTFIRNDNDFRDYGFLEEEYQLQSQFTRNDDANDYNDRTEDICLPTLRLEPDLVRIMAESRNPKELLYVWRAWREASGRPLRRRYLRFIGLSNKASRLNGFNSTTDFWQRDYESDDLEVDLERIWDEVRPLYEQLHTYVRRKLKERYGDTYFSFDGTIPAHLLGNMWGQSWVNLLDITIPYENRPFLDVTQNMVRQGYTPARIYRTAEDFYVSLGFNPLPESFWQRSLLIQPPDREVICHASAWDFCNGVDYRIKHCTQITMKDFITAHHELGHIYYGMAYKNLPHVFRSPLEFDPGSKYHIPAHIPYIRYFIAYILQFQIHEELCLAAGHTGDPHKCDIYGSQAAGEKLQKLLSLGKSQPWRIALSDFTDGRTTRLDAGPMLRYFRHLNDWLARENREDQVGWYTNQALFALTGALVNTSSGVFIRNPCGSPCNTFPDGLRLRLLLQKV
ncbi:Angiotensin-converting enzyme [Armadillidium nasatum]|uniref:Angiotensin-converting enzyme n=1 Tax=Armadillidium nasatum TaxID=96803 RepID=A0A5N5SKD8_9CRUS|nr:Angiotensin-converting enzyme [Armadillidium nasatum]